MRRDPTEAERRMWSMVRAKRLGGYKFKRQEQLGDYIVDFVCFEARLIVEVDGSQHAGNPADEQRDDWLRAQGFHVLHIWNNEVLSNPEGVGTAILERLRR